MGNLGLDPVFGKDTIDTKISHLESTPVCIKTPEPKTLTLPTESSKLK